jgi:anti-sigma regulatory factor (Ser/Thr protein kinase)
LETAHYVGVEDASHIAEARRVATELALRLDFDETEAGNVALVVTEAAKNLLKHAGGGDLFLRAVPQNSISAVEMVAVDKGPGIENIRRSFEDGYSTTGTPGTGLGTISRLSSIHDIYSQRARGTALFAQISKRKVFRETEEASPRFRIGALSIPKSGEPVCGDGWAFLKYPGGGRLIVADGLGHGLLAADAARAAVRIAEQYIAETGVPLMQRIDSALRSTRGAAVLSRKSRASGAWFGIPASGISRGRSSPIPELFSTWCRTLGQPVMRSRKSSSSPTPGTREAS